MYGGGSSNGVFAYKSHAGQSRDDNTRCSEELMLKGKIALNNCTYKKRSSD